MEKENFDFDDLQKRGDIAFNLFKEILDELGLFVSVQDDGSKKEIIFSDKEAYITKGEKRGVATDLKLLNMIIYKDIDEVPEYVLKKHKDDIVLLNHNNKTS